MGEENIYDYIICGAGCAGLSLAYRLCDPSFRHLRILILESSPKVLNDRTWSSWQLKSKLYFPAIHHKRWESIFFGSRHFESKLRMEKYIYCTIRGIDFYNLTLDKINRSPHIEIRYERITSVQIEDDQVSVSTSEQKYRAGRVFDSIVRKYPVESDLFVWQHFKGWLVETETNRFDADTAYLMDFRIPQEGETRFVYVLPFTEKQAFIEATVFGKTLPGEEFYDQIMASYIAEVLEIDKYKVVESEYGKIPMTTAKFAEWHKNIIPIGTNAMTVKASSGYAFVRIQEEAEALVSQIRTNHFNPLNKEDRFLNYDKTLLNVAIKNRQPLDKVFSLMFKHNHVDQVLKFLDNKTSLLEEVRIFSTLPTISFAQAFAQENVFKLK